MFHSDQLARGQIVPRPEGAPGVTHRLDTGCGKLYLTVNRHPETGQILETFITTGSDGGYLIYTEAASRLISLALRAGVAVGDIGEKNFRSASLARRPSPSGWPRLRRDRKTRRVLPDAQNHRL